MSLSSGVAFLFEQTCLLYHRPRYAKFGGNGSLVLEKNEKMWNSFVSCGVFREFFTDDETSPLLVAGCKF